MLFEFSFFGIGSLVFPLVLFKKYRRTQQSLLRETPPVGAFPHLINRCTSAMGTSPNQRVRSQERSCLPLASTLISGLEYNRNFKSKKRSETFSTGGRQDGCTRFLGGWVEPDAVQGSLVLWQRLNDMQVCSVPRDLNVIKSIWSFAYGRGPQNCAPYGFAVAPLAKIQMVNYRHNTGIIPVTSLWCASSPPCMIHAGSWGTRKERQQKVSEDIWENLEYFGGLREIDLIRLVCCLGFLTQYADDIISIAQKEWRNTQRSLLCCESLQRFLFFFSQYLTSNFRTWLICNSLVTLQQQQATLDQNLSRDWSKNSISCADSAWMEPPDFDIFLSSWKCIPRNWPSLTATK